MKTYTTHTYGSKQLTSLEPHKQIDKSKELGNEQQMNQKLH